MLLDFESEALQSVGDTNSRRESIYVVLRRVYAFGVECVRATRVEERVHLTCIALCCWEGLQEGERKENGWLE